MTYETVIGLEVHLQLATKTKIFCGCSTKFAQAPNSQACPVCLGLPGSLPVLNEEAFLDAVKVALALNCKINKTIKFDRKNYFYPDLPKNFQISQYDLPLSYDGFLDINTGKEPVVKKIRIKRVHMEEDAGKLMHPENEDYSVVDYNRTGVPLLEIVTEPDISSPEEAYNYLTRLKAILEYLEVSDCDMEKGSLRCDANISLKKFVDTKLGTKVELKNMNSFKGVRLGLEYEEKRQASALSGGERILQETRLWDADKCVTNSMRLKEEAEDYRYFPEPDLVPFMVDETIVQKIKKSLPEMPEARAGRFQKEYGLSSYDADVLTSRKDIADYFEECCKFYKKAKTIANWLMGDIAAQLNSRNIGIKDLKVSPSDLASLLGMIDSGSLNAKMAKDVLIDAVETGSRPRDIVKAKGLSQVSDKSLIDNMVEAVLAKNKKSVDDYKGGKKVAFIFLVGQVMKESKGKASPLIVNELLKKKLGE